MRVRFISDDMVDTLRTTVELRDPTIEQAMDAFRSFLLASGFNISANEEIVLWDHKQEQLNKEAIAEWEKDDNESI